MISYENSSGSSLWSSRCFLLRLIWRGAVGAALVEGLFWGGVLWALGIDNYVGVVVPVANEGMIVRGVVWAHALLHPVVVLMVPAGIVSLYFF